MPNLKNILLATTTASLVADAMICPYFFGNSLRSYFGLETERSNINNIIITMEQISLIPLAVYYARLYSNPKKNKIGN